jgi:hypothetical protein
MSVPGRFPFGQHHVLLLNGTLWHAPHSLNVNITLSEQHNALASMKRDEKITVDARPNNNRNPTPIRESM